ncbi:hypothetical protein DPMN_089683 [Dreissena polymorpha]|uniref:Uncharacterized protein n=1 Tax=Dreissena polymorpha TaxID=45954 RepID=A0A9D4QYB5_DREPO|nr:hypothetical protein DPMN_089683 [Dreissena polymorpha]
MSSQDWWHSTIYTPQKCASMFMACCRMHNLCMQNGLPEPPAIDKEEDHDRAVIAPDNNVDFTLILDCGSYVRDIQA